MKKLIRTETAKKWGGTVTLPLTDFLEINQKYIIQEADIDGERCIIIKEDKGITKLGRLVKDK